MSDPYEPFSGSPTDYAPTLLSLKHWTGLNDPLCEVTGDSPKGSFTVEVSSTAGLSKPSMGTVIWRCDWGTGTNFEATSATQTENLKWWDTSKYWTILPPTIVGFHGVGITFDQEQVKLDESHGTAVTPQSLYEAQLEKRLDHLPPWIEALK